MLGSSASTYISGNHLHGSMVSGFLDSHTGRPWNYDQKQGEFEYYQGTGASAIEIVVVDHGSRPTKQFLQQVYSDRRSRRVNPILVVALYGDDVGMCGPSGEDPPVFRDVDYGQAERVCDAALSKPDRHIAQSFLSDTLPQLDESLAGLRNQGLLSTHELKVGVPDRDDWGKVSKRAQQALTDDPRELIEGLNYKIDRLTDQSYVLKDNSDDHERAVAMFLQDDESFDHSQKRFVGQSPVAYALNEADKRNIDYVIGSSGDTLRLYTTNPEAGFGSRGRTDTYVELNTNLLADEKAAYLWLLFSANALRDDGTLHQIMEDSKEYATDLGGRLQDRIYDDVVPDLAEAIAQARDIDNPTKEELDQTYEMTLFLLYRLLFIAYAEDEEFLPRRRNGRYDKRSLKQKAHNLHEIVQEGSEFDDAFYDHWDDVMTLSRAIHYGHDEMGLPAYEGRILSEDEDISEAGARLSNIRLNNAEFAPVLFRLLVDETEDGYQGPVDFRNIGVREFGVIYEGLLESELSVAEQPLKTDDDGQYIPVDTTGDTQQTFGDDSANIDVEKNEVYLHGQSGERKATGTFYTKTCFVEHLLDSSLDPALDNHIERIDRLRQEDGEKAAAEAFFDIRVSDIAMGSGHFLVGAVDRIETKLRAYLTENQLTPVESELDNLKDVAEDAFEQEEYTPNIERGQLLRRQVARRCIYGVDLNPLSTELARLSIWVHTFVPGLPLTFLDYNLVSGDSLAGIGTLTEVADILDVEQSSLGMFAGGQSVMSEVRDDISRLGNFADASAEQVQKARETQTEVEEKLTDVRARLDVLAASRIDDDIDTDPVSDVNTDIVTEDCYEEAQDVLGVTDPLHFPAAFPEVFEGDNPGFDVIIGNPPWEKTKVEKHEFWARYHPGLRSMTQSDREHKIAELEEKRPDLLEELQDDQDEQQKRSKILTNGPYPGVGSGDPDLYQAFSWRFWRLIQSGGQFGVVLPREALLSKGSEAFRRHLLENGVISDLTFILNNKQWAFEEVHPQTTIGLCSAQKIEPTDDQDVPIRGPYPNRNEFDAGVTAESHLFGLSEILSWTGTASLPLLPPENGAIDAFDQIQRSPAVVNAERDDWNVVPYRTGITSSDCLDDVSDTDDEVWPVYKGSSFDLWVPDTGDHYGQGSVEELTEYLTGKRDRSRKWPDNDRQLPCNRPTIAFRRVTNRTNQRTVISSLIPPNVFMRDADPFLLWEDGGTERNEAYLIGVLSSIPLDWFSRRFVEKHLDYYIFNGLPIPELDTESQLGDRAIELSGRLCAVDDRYADWAHSVGVEYGPLADDKKQEKIYELDAVVAHLYELTRDQVTVIYATFHEGWDYKKRLDSVLEYYDAWADQLDIDHTDSEIGYGSRR